MQTATISHRLIKKIKDERFEEENLHLYHLLLHIGVRDFQALVVADDNRVLLLEDYVLPEVDSQDSLLETLKEIFDSHAVLTAGFWKTVSVSFKTSKFVQVPLALFNEDSMMEYLSFNAQVDPKKETILKTVHNKNETVTIFAVSSDTVAWFKDLYKASTLLLVHQSAAIIEGVVHASLASKKNNQLFIYIDRFKLHIIACNKGQLLYYNQFVVKQFEDYVRYIMLVMKSLQMDQQTSEVVLWGYIGKNSPHYHEFYKFINNVTFGERPSSLKFSYMFDEVQDHHFFDLYCIHLLK